MAMQEAIKNFPKQFEYKPDIENGGKLKKYRKFIVLGMGGSNLAPELFRVRDPHLDIQSYRGYGLPALDPKVLKESLIIANSYSGNTEETLDGFKAALKKKYPVAAISTGGKLMDLARKNKVPYIQMPSTGIQPRIALGYSLKGLAEFMGNKKLSAELSAAAKTLRPHELERAGKALAKKLKGHVPVIYSSLRNEPIVYNWKIKFNETGKIPAYANTFSELNHNEMTGFDVTDTTRDLSKVFYFIFLKDADDNQRITKRMNITERLYRERGLPVEVIILSGKSPFQKILSDLVLADWTAYHTAKEYNVEAEQVPMVEEFKKLIK
jgi:glucose/mannose-6-phosphate isomerase